MRILLAGQKYFGAAVFMALREVDGIEIAAVSAPVRKEKPDRLFAIGETYGVPIIPAGSLNAGTMPDGIDLIVAAHSHDFIGQKTRMRARFGGIGYHPSLLPLHRGRDAVRWTIIMGDKVTGGTVYRLSNKTDGGNIILQKFVFVPPRIDATELWRASLAPLGVALLRKAVEGFRDHGFINGVPQDENLATWEPSIDRPPLFKPDLLQLPANTEDVKGERGSMRVTLDDNEVSYVGNKCKRS